MALRCCYIFDINHDMYTTSQRDKSYDCTLVLHARAVRTRRQQQDTHSLLQHAAAVVVGRLFGAFCRSVPVTSSFVRVSCFGPASSPFRTENFKGNFNCSGRIDNASTQSSIPVFGPTSSQSVTTLNPQRSPSKLQRPQRVHGSPAANVNTSTMEVSPRVSWL